MDIVVKRIVRGDGRFRISVCQRHDGLFFYRQDRFTEWDDAPHAWMDGYPPSGIFSTADEAEAEARATISWLRNDDV